MPHIAAGCRIDPPVSDPSASGVMPAATATADPPLDPPGMRSSAQGLRDGPNAEFSVDDPIANSSQLVLPTMTAPAACEPRHDRGVVGRDEGFEDARRRRRPQAARADVVLERHRHAGQRGVAKPVAVAIDLGRAGERLLGRHGVERVQRRVGGFDAGQRVAADLNRRASARPDRVANVRQRRRATDARLISGRIRHQMTRGTLKKPPPWALGRSVAFRRIAEHLVEVEGGRDLVGPIRASARDAVRRRRHAARVDLLKLAGVREDVAELSRKQFHFGRVELEMGERGDRFDLRSRQRSRAWQMLAWPLGARRSG